MASPNPRCYAVLGMILSYQREVTAQALEGYTLKRSKVYNNTRSGLQYGWSRFDRTIDNVAKSMAMALIAMT